MTQFLDGVRPELPSNHFSQSSPLTAYPNGLSVMAISDAALGWPEQYGMVETFRSKEQQDYNYQRFTRMSGTIPGSYHRRWATGASAWREWEGLAQAWAPTILGGGTTLNQGNWSLHSCNYVVTGDFCSFQCGIQNITGSAGDTGAWQFTLPFTPVGVAHQHIGTGTRRSGSSRRPLHIAQNGNTDSVFVFYSDVNNVYMTAAEQGNGWYMMFTGQFRIR